MSVVVKNFWLFMWGFSVAIYALVVWPLKRIKPELWDLARQEWREWLEAVRRR